VAEPACSLGELVVSKPGGEWLGLLFGCGVVSTRVARSSRLGSTGFGRGVRAPVQPAWGWKLVEPTCERQRVGRVETISWVSGDLWFCPYARQVTVLQRCALSVLRLSICLP